MANVGKKTGKQTQAGRDVYETPEGEMVSEKSTTFEYKGKWINIPTIHGGKQYSEDQLMEMLDKGLIKPTSTHDELEEAIQAAQSRSDSLEFNKGGTPMLEKQMELFEDGGLRDEGGMVDEESGNEVPVGSTRKEVRDDIPAMLSEGEFVFPADVVRYIGLENLMRMRQNAKQGLKQMEAMGQMGNGDEAVLPDDMPFGMMDLIIVEGEEEEEEDKPKEMAQGGVIKAQEGTFVIPKFDPRNQDVRDYTNEAGEIRKIPFLGGKPLYPIPVGFYPVGTDIPTEDEAAEVAPVDRGNDDRTPPPEPSEFQKAGGWDMDFGDPPDSKKVDLWIAEAKKTTGNAPMIATGVASLFGGIPAAFVHAANKFNAKGRDANLQRAIEAAKKTPTAGQVAALNQIATDIEKGADETILDKLGGAVKELFGVSDEKAKKVQKVAVKSGTSIKPKLRPTPTEEPKTVDLGDMTGAPGFRDRDDIKATEQPKTVDLGDMTGAPGFRDTDNTLQQNLTELGLTDDDMGLPTFPVVTSGTLDQKITKDKASNTTTFDDAEEITRKMTDRGITLNEQMELLNVADPDVPATVDDETLEKLKAPDIPKEDREDIDSVLGLPTEPSQAEIDLYEQMVQDLEAGTKPLEVALEEISPEAAKTLADFEPKGAGLGLANESPKTVKTVAEQFAEAMAPVTGGTTDDDDGGPAFPSIAPVTKEPPKISDIENYLAKVAQEEKTPTPTSTSSGGDDDDGPSLAEQMQKQMQEKATESLDKFDENVEKVKAAAGPDSDQQAIEKEAAAVKEKLEQQEKGIKTGFKKGGLASRKK